MSWGGARKTDQQQYNLYSLIWDEVCWSRNDTQWGGDYGFNQNLLFTGLMIKYNDASRFEIGYLHQYINGTNGSSDQMNHVVFKHYLLIRGTVGEYKTKQKAKHEISNY